MNCDDCTSIEGVKRSTELALKLLQGDRELTEQETQDAFDCRECASRKLAEDAGKRVKDAGQ